MLIDSHCHLDFPELAADRAGVLERAKAAGIERHGHHLDPREARSTRSCAIAEAHPEVWCSVGTHPHHADEELDILADDLIRLS